MPQGWLKIHEMPDHLVALIAQEVHFGTNTVSNNYEAKVIRLRRTFIAAVFA